eukprot:291514_1
MTIYQKQERSIYSGTKYENNEIFYGVYHRTINETEKTKLEEDEETAYQIMTIYQKQERSIYSGTKYENNEIFYGVYHRTIIEGIPKNTEKNMFEENKNYVITKCSYTNEEAYHQMLKKNQPTEFESNKLKAAVKEWMEDKNNVDIILKMAKAG